jgi:hypothetical protein
MGVSGGPYIVRDSSLILELDAADRNSYVSGSLIWNSLSTSRITGSLTGSIGYPTFTQEFLGALDVAGNSYVDLGKNSDFYFSGSQGFTISVWVKSKSSSSQHLVNRFNSGVLGNYFMQLSSNKLTMFREIIPYSIASSTSNYSINTVYNFCSVYDGTNMQTYINGVADGIPSASANISADQSNVRLLIGASETTGNPSSFLSGSLYVVQIYNRNLNQSEIQQNYNAQKSRFGLK